MNRINSSSQNYFDFDGMDTSVDPAENFHLFANGQWLKKTEIPPSLSSWGTIQIINNELNDKLLRLINNQGTSPEEKLCKALYDSALNMQKRNETGIQPLRKYLILIDNIDSENSLFDAVAQLISCSIKPFAEWVIDPHPYNNKDYILHLADGGISLPDPDIYLEEKDSEKNGHAKKRALYREYITQLFGLAEMSHENAQSVLSIETELAKNFLPKEVRNDPEKTTNIKGLDRFWSEVFTRCGYKIAKVNYKNSLFPEVLSKLLANESLDHVKTYLKFCLLDAFAPSLGQDFYELHWGGNDPLTIEKRSLKLVNTHLGHALGKIYIQNHFPASRKEKIIHMVHLIKETLIVKIKSLAWMLEPTKQKAIEKVHQMVIEIGYPDEGYWDDYSTLTLDKDHPYIVNAIALNKFQVERAFKKLQTKVDKKNWPYSPQLVNACNIPNENKIILPAGILEFPFVTSDDATNWGAIGSVISHEIIHSFDNNGRKFSADGKKENWWQEEDAVAYENFANGIVKQYEGYSVTFQDGSSMKVNGKITLSENIADFGGLKIAYLAMEKLNFPIIDGWTAEQRFFLGYAQIYRKKDSDQRQKVSLSKNLHSPQIWRVNGPLSQMEEFKRAFSLPDSCPMVIPEELKSKMWG